MQATACTRMHTAAREVQQVWPVVFVSCKRILASVAFLSLASQHLFWSCSSLQAREESASLFKMTYELRDSILMDIL